MRSEELGVIVSAEPTIKFMAPLKGEDSPQRGEMSAQPTEWGVELAKPQVLSEGSASEWRVES